MKSSVNLVYSILDYLFLSVMLAVCVVALLMIRRLLQGTPRKLGLLGFGVLAAVTLVSLLRTIYTDLTPYDEINVALIQLLDILNAFVRVAGIGLLALALLSTVRDVSQLFTGSNQQRGTDDASRSLPPHYPQGQHSATSLNPQSIPPQQPYGQPAPSYGQPSANTYTPPSQPYGQPSANSQQPWGQTGQPPQGPGQQGQHPNQGW